MIRQNKVIWLSSTPRRGAGGRIYFLFFKCYFIKLHYNHFINSLNQFRSVETCFDMFKINFNFEKKIKKIWNFQKNWSGRWRTTKQLVVGLRSSCNQGIIHFSEMFNFQGFTIGISSWGSIAIAYGHLVIQSREIIHFS